MTDKTIKPLVRGAYDLQKLRIQTGLRLVATFKAKLGQAPGEKEDELDVEGKRLLKDLRAEYSRITDGITTSRISRLEFETDGLIDSVSEVALLDQYSQLDKAEKDSFKFIEQALKAVPVYSKFLREVKGIGPAMAGVIVSEIDIYKARHPSSLWKYAGLDVASDGKGRSRKAEHLVDIDYIAADKTEKTRKSITFNPFLKTKLVGVLASSFLRAGSKDNPYQEIYAGYKNRLENNEAHKEKSKGHRHNMAMRYMIKMFLVDLHREWRKLEGLPESVPYSEAKLSLKHAA